MTLPTDQQQFFEKMVKDHGSQLYAHIRTIVLTHDDADDVLQETFIKAWKALPAYRGDAAISTWLYRIATNEALQQLRRKKWKKVFGLAALNEQSAPAEQLNTGSEEDQLQEALKRLTVHQRKIFGMRYFNETPFAEIALVLGLAEGTVKATFHQSVKKLEEYLRQTAY